MTLLNFNAMSETQLRAYVYEHREDREAFYAFVDRLKTKSRSVAYPTLTTSKEINKVV